MESSVNKWYWKNWTTTWKKNKNKPKQETLNLKISPITKGNSKWMIDLNMKCNTTKLLKENIGESHHNIWLGKELFNMT